MLAIIRCIIFCLLVCYPKNLKLKICRTIPLREERRPRVFESRLLRRIFGPKRDEVTREWITLHNEELNDL
jgi:hypothetical protein